MKAQAILLLVLVILSLGCRSKADGEVSPLTTPTATATPPPSLPVPSRDAATVKLGEFDSNVPATLYALKGTDPCEFGKELQHLPAGTIVTVIGIYPKCPGGVYRVEVGSISGYVSGRQTQGLTLPPQSGFLLTTPEARLQGRLLIRRGTEAWLVSPTSPAADTKLWEGEHWSFDRVIDGPGGPAFYWVHMSETVAPTGTSQTVASLVRYESGQSRLLFSVQAPLSLRRVPGLAISPSGTRVAYTDPSGLHVRDLITGTDRILSVLDTKNAACSPYGSFDPVCAYPFDPQWSPDGNTVLANRILYEPLWTFAFDPDGPPSVGRKLPFIARRGGWGGTAFCSDDGNHFSGVGPPVIYDVSSESRVSLATRGGDSTFSGGCALNVNGEALTVWSGGPDARASVSFHDTSGAAVITVEIPLFEPLFPTPAIWLPDASGVIVSGRLPAGLQTALPRSLYYIVDRGGGVRSIPLETGEILAVLPD